MSSVKKSEGTTESERYLAKLADRSFLNLWSYPNPFIGKMVDGRGKELCDLLVVCGDHVIVFSDKTVEWPPNTETELAWRRWYKRAINKSVRQIRGAARWIREYPDRIFLDPACSQKLPIALPPADRIQLHGVVVARGSGEASKAYFKGGVGSFGIDPAIRGGDHFKQKIVQPFVIGDVHPDGIFVHVLDDGSLDIAMQELDTVTDLTHYLSKKENLVRSGRLAMAAGEEDLVAYYMTHMESEHEHGFPRPDGSPFESDEKISIRDVYVDLRANEQYIAKKQADDISYVWDGLIKAFTDHMLAGTTLVPEGEEFSLEYHEQGVRHMALVPRYLRRSFGEGVQTVLHAGREHDRYVRAFVQNEGVPGSETGFFFMALQVPKFKVEGGYDGYREVRRGVLETYALALLQKQPHLERVVGVGSEPLPKEGESGRGSSEDLILATLPEWTDELVADLEERKKVLNIMQEGQYHQRPSTGSEWPDVGTPVQQQPVAPVFPTQASRPAMNRKQRRVMAAKKRKKPKW